VLQDVLTLHGSQFLDAAVIVASPPCQAYSYRAMPWKRAKALPPPDNTLFEACFRIQREACEAAGRYIPLIVENVRGAQKWVGPARANFGSFYLWGDVGRAGNRVIALNGKIGSDVGVRACRHTDGVKNAGTQWRENGCNAENKMVPSKVPGLNWSKYGTPEYKAQGFNVVAAQRFRDGVKQPGISGTRNNGKGNRWFQEGAARHGSRSNSRKAASAMIAKIPFPLALHIARTFKPLEGAA